MRNCNLFGTKSDVSRNTVRQTPWRTRVSSFGTIREMRRGRTHPWTCTAFPSPAVYSASSHFGPFPTPFASHLPVQRANRTSTFAFHLSRISPFPTPIRPPFHPTPSRPFLPPPSGPFRLFTSHTPLVFDHLVVFLSRKRQNRRFGAGGTCKRGRRGHQSKQLPTKHQVAEGARGQKQERDHPDLPRTVDFDVLDVIF